MKIEIRIHPPKAKQITRSKLLKKIENVLDKDLYGYYKIRVEES